MIFGSSLKSLVDDNEFRVPGVEGPSTGPFDRFMVQSNVDGLRAVSLSNGSRVRVKCLRVSRNQKYGKSPI